MSYEHQLLAQKTKTWKTEKNTFLSEQKKKSIQPRMKNMEKDKITDNGNINRQNFRDVLNQNQIMQDVI